MDPSRGYSSYHYGPQYGAEQSTLEKITAKVYQAKLKVNKTLKKPEDEHLVASDAELDAKLETYRHVRQSCADLQRIVSMYATRVYALAQAENEIGRYLKQHGERDRTRAGKMMQATGKSLSCASQQRLALRVPLTRLGGEVETFSNRAVSDCELKVNEMETARNNYRSSLLWMKDVSERLDPEAYNRLEKFRKVQAQVKRSKEQFDRQKLDAMQKVDLLVASRCNMFSRVLVLYQQTIVQFSHKTARIMCAVADAFQGYQFFEFNMLRELTDCTRKLARETSSRVAGESSSDADTDDYDDGEETLKQVETRLSEIVSEQSLSAQPGLNEADTLRLPALGGAFSYGASSTEQPTADTETQDPTQLYDHVRRSVFQKSTEQDAAQQPQEKSALQLNPQPKPSGDGGASKKHRKKHSKTTLSKDANKEIDASRRGPIRDDAEYYTDEPSTQRGDPNPDIALEKLDELFAKEYHEDEDPFTEAIDLTVSAPKKTQKETSAASQSSAAAAAAVAAAVQSGAADALLLEGLDLNATPDADRALLNDLFGTTDADADLDASYFQSQAAASSGSAPLMTSEFARMFGVASTKPKAAAAAEAATSLGDDDPWNSFSAALASRQMDALRQSDGENSASSAQQTGAAERVSPRPNSTESALLENLSKFSSKGGAQQQSGPSLASLAAQRQGGSAPGPAPPAANINLNLAAATSAKAAAPPSGGSKKDATLGSGKKEDLAAWFNMFADLDPLANPDKVGRKPGQDDGFNEA